MVTILIKSFNRPYYLDRCLHSIALHVKGNYQIIVLDDGTPKKYLQRIAEKHPHITITLSENHHNKTAAIEENLSSDKEIDGFSIPTELWRHAVKDASPYFIMTEDDVWFTRDSNVQELQKAAENHGIHLLKLGWLGNQSDDAHLSVSALTGTIERTVPNKLMVFPSLLNHWFFYNRYSFFSLLYRLRLVDNETKRKYWALNSILMGFWSRDYWLHVWKDAAGRVDEKQQLRNAALWYRKNRKNKNAFARLKSEAMKTTFQSSSTNSYHKYGYGFDVNYFNHLINEAWYKGEFDPMQNFPSDFSLEYFEQFIDGKINREQWHKWVAHFKDQYRNLGADVS